MIYATVGLSIFHYCIDVFFFGSTLLLGIFHRVYCHGSICFFHHDSIGRRK